MKTKHTRLGGAALSKPQRALWLAAVVCATAGHLLAATATIYTNNFESYANPAPSLADTTDADPTGIEWAITDDAALSPTTAGAGVQVINWLTNASGGANQALLLRANSQAQLNLFEVRSGTRYQLDFKTYVVREPTTSQGFYIALRGYGSDVNADDFLAYQVNRATNSTTLRYYDGVGPGAGAWVNTTATQTTDRWQHHRIVIDPNALTFTLYLDDMATPVVSNVDISRSQVAVPTLMAIIHEGNSADDGYFAFDDISLTVENARDLSTTITENFESYPARAAVDDDADPLGPWITTEVAGTAQTDARAPSKVQIVGTDVVQPRSGTKCLKVEGGQRAGATIAWGTPPQSDVQITWWARVPASVQGATALYLRMSLYGAEDGSTYKGDSSLLGWGSRNTTVGDATSLLHYPAVGWVDTQVDYTPDVWEEYRLVTHTAINKYTLIKNPSSANPQVIIDRGAMGGDTTPIPTSTGPILVAAWSSSNGSGHPAAYIDDIEIKSLVSNVEPLGEPYTITNYGTRFTNYTVLVAGANVGRPVVDPRDNSTIYFAVDAAPPAGGIYRATKVASGNWVVDPTPIVTNIDRPSGLAITADGTLWWSHDYGGQVVRLRSPWASNTNETVVAQFGDAAAATPDDDPIDLVVAPQSFTGKPGFIVVADRGLDGDALNAVHLIDPATTTLDQTGYQNYLVGPTPSDLGANLTQIAALPASGEVATVSVDGYIVAIDPNGTLRYINALNLWPLGGSANGVGIAADPVTGKIWVADNAKDEIWTVDPSTGADQVEIGFPLTDPLRTDRQFGMHDPAMAFAPNGDFMVITDGNMANGGGGRLVIFHNEAISLPTFKITSITRSGPGYKLTWESAGGAKYRVQRGTTLDSFQDITGDLSVTEFTDTNTVGTLFYRVIAKP